MGIGKGKGKGEADGREIPPSGDYFPRSVRNPGNALDFSGIISYTSYRGAKRRAGRKRWDWQDQDETSTKPWESRTASRSQPSASGPLCVCRKAIQSAQNRSRSGSGRGEIWIRSSIIGRERINHDRTCRICAKSVCGRWTKSWPRLVKITSVWPSWRVSDQILSPS